MTTTDHVADLLAAEGIIGTPDRTADFATQLHEHVHAVWFGLAADILRPTGQDPDGEPAPVPIPDEHPQPIAA